MDQRYSHPDVTHLWSLESTYAQWLHIETLVLTKQRDLGIVSRDQTRSLHERLTCDPLIIDPAAVARILEIEKRTKHDVVAFLEWLRGPFGHVGRWLHYGLTSSDVVDTAQGMRFRAMLLHVHGAISKLQSELGDWTADDTPILGRTHGQVAELMTMRARAGHWLATLDSASADLLRDSSRMAVCKLSGPVGTYAHNPPEVEQWVAKILSLRPHGPGASQIAIRPPFAAWANSAALVVGACAKIAHDIRLMDLLGETTKTTADGQVASSSMAHKVNPIRAEQIGGMARLARGYAAMLQPLDVWLERDISHSSVERVAVPDLWHVTMHTIEQTTILLRNLILDQWKINRQIQGSINPLVAERTLHFIATGEGIEEARQAALNPGGDLHAQPRDAYRLMRNYPPSVPSN